jgi:hypothetical protein
MKLRIRGNSIRLRLGESEVAQLAREGRVADSIQFSMSPLGGLAYTIVTSPDEKEILARYANNEIKITVPAAAAKQWANSEQVGLTRVQPVGDAAELSILIEKDFRCLAPRPGEDESDSFVNPADKKSCEPH